MPGIDRWDVEIEAGAVKLDGTLTIPRHRHGVIVFANGVGRRRDSVVAGVLNTRGLGTLIVDLRSREGAEPTDQTTELAFDVETMAERLTLAIDYVTRQSITMGMRIGLFGSSSGAAATLIAAANRPLEVRAVVTRSGRSDLAGEALRRVLAPSLFIVAERDPWLQTLNERAGAQMRAPHELQIVMGASHLFDEPGKLEAVGSLAADWYWTYVRPEQPLERPMDPHIWA